MESSLNAPEPANGSSADLVRDGDLKRVDIAARLTDLLVDSAELEARYYGGAPLISRNTSDVLSRSSRRLGFSGFAAKSVAA